MADVDIDSLLEQGLRAAAAQKQENATTTAPAGEAPTNGRSDPAQGRSKSGSRSKSRSRSGSRSRRKAASSSSSSSRRRRSRSRSRSRSSRRRSSRRSRSRSRSRDSRRRSRRGRSRSRSGSRDRDSRRRGGSRRGRSRSRSRSRSRDGDVRKPAEPHARSTSAERAERAKQRELMELTRDHRTVFVGQLTQKVRERDLEKFFAQFGKLEHVLLIRDKFTNRSKGFAYVELSNLEDVPTVLLLNGTVPDFQSFPIMVKASEAEKNFAARKDSVMNSAAKATAAATLGPAAGGGPIGGAGGSMSAAARIYCGNLHTNITEDDLRAVFQAFGEVLSVNINRDELGRSRGFGFIQFNTPQEANFALSKGNGLELAGNHLKLGTVNDHHGGGGGYGGHAGSGGSWKLEDEEGVGMTMNAQSRSALMAKLAGNKNIFPTPTPTPVFPGAAPLVGELPGVAGLGAIPVQAVPVPAAPAPVPAAAHQSQRAAALAAGEMEGSESFCFVIKNMFDVEEEKRAGNPEWDLEIKQDVEDECENYGTVLHTFVEREKPGGLVYVLFDKLASSVAAAQKLHGRWFSQRQISVRYLSSQEYVGMFPEARMAVQTARANSGL